MIFSVINPYLADIIAYHERGFSIFEIRFLIVEKYLRQNNQKAMMVFLSNPSIAEALKKSNYKARLSPRYWQATDLIKAIKAGKEVLV